MAKKKKPDKPKSKGVISRSKARVKVKPKPIRKKSRIQSVTKKTTKKNTKKSFKPIKGKARKMAKPKPGGKRLKKIGRRKDNIADRAYEKYLKKMDMPSGSSISVAEMNNVVRERIAMEVRYDTDVPALFSNIMLSASAIGDVDPSKISVERFVRTPFGASFIVQNNGYGDVYLNKDGQAIFNINGGTVVTTQSSTTVSLPSKEERGGESTVEFSSNWIQSLSEARNLGQWVLTNQADGGEEYSMEIFGNPYIDVGDIVIVEYGKLNLNDSLRFIVRSIEHDFSQGLKTVVTVRRVYPNAAKMFTHSSGESQSPEAWAFA